MEIKLLQGLPLPLIANVFNKAFSDYNIPVQYTDEGFKNKIIGEGIDLAYSPGAFVDGELVGFILHGLDTVRGEKRVFNAGTGVIPTHRGNRLVEQLYNYILPVLARQGYRRHQLEVLKGNDKAEKIYLKVGFKRTRTVTAFKGVIDVKVDRGFEVTQLAEPDWQLLESYCTVVPTWQNDFHCIERLKDNYKVLVAYADDEPAGFIIVDITTGRIKQFAVRQGYRRKGVGSMLFSYAANGKGEVAFTNFDESDSGSLAFFSSLGLQPVVRLYEMEFEYTGQ